MDYAQFQQADRRRVVLDALRHANQYRAAASLLRAYCQGVGHTVSADRLEADLHWLAEQGLLELKREHGVSVATLNQRGLDVATGAAQVPGVQPPPPPAAD